MISALVLAVALTAGVTGTERPFVIYNEDPDNVMQPYWHEDPAHYTADEIRAYVRKVIGGGNVSHFFACVNARVSSYPSKVAPNLWDALGKPGYETPQWLKAAKDLVVDQGVDQFRIYIEECRKGGVSPWLSVRMNDIHYPYATNSYRNIGFWKEHPELWIDPSAKDRTDGPWGDRAFDYRKEPVQAYMLAYIDEALSRYDADGIELDWMRFEHHAPRAVARTEGAARINDFMRKAKALVARHERVRGHRILIAGRVDTEPESALNHGTDYRTWAKEGLVDWLIPCNFFQTVDFDLPFAKWAAELKELNPRVLVIPGLDNGVWRKGPWSRGRLTADEYAAWADRMFRQGATGVYLFNFFGMYVFGKLKPDPVCWDFVINEGLTPGNVARHAKSIPDNPPRECVVFGWCPPAETKKPAVTLHVILQSHLDPVWLWNREQGIDAALATARTMCDILDDYPETHVTRGEAWIYECCERYDPDTFRRLKAHVAGGRLHVVGGEYVQPDCNLPAADSLADHLSFAGRYFREKVGVPRVRTGYNPDSFGHGAYLPRLLVDAGMENYLFMRPGAHEKTLPGEVFRWRSPDGAEVLAARIDGCYNPSSEDGAMYWQVTNAVACCDRRIGHCFTMIGVGDHGGGPARAQVDWILKHRGEWPDVKIVFSHPDAFFAAVRASGAEFPVVTGELQHHAIGCYSALSRIKREVREAEEALRRDGGLLSPEVLDECRRKLYFATFHDTLGGCSIASAYPDIYDSLGYVRSVCRDARISETRRRNAKLPGAKCQRVIFDNPGKGRWRGVTEFEAWLKSHEGWYSWRKELNEKLCLRDADGRCVPIQVVPHRDKSGRPQPNLALALDLGPGETRTYFVCSDKTEGEASIEDGKPLSAEEAPRFRFEVIADGTDTWSHNVNGYPAATRTMERTGEKRLLTTGCILSETLDEYADPSGRAFVRTRLERNLPGVRLKARVVWSQPREIVKLAIEPGFAVTGRVDRVAGGNVIRALDGEEWPFAGAVTLLGADGRRFSVVCRDVTALDVQKDGTVRLTLFRTPPYSEHVPAKVPNASCPVADLGEHFFDIQILREASDERIADALYALASPLVFSETTKGVGK